LQSWIMGFIVVALFDALFDALCATRRRDV